MVISCLFVFATISGREGVQSAFRVASCVLFPLVPSGTLQGNTALRHVCVRCAPESELEISIRTWNRPAGEGR